jgi:hypothetical protein
MDGLEAILTAAKILTERFGRECAPDGVSVGAVDREGGVQGCGGFGG